MQHYRIKDYSTGDGVIIRVERFNVIKETPCGYWVADEYAPKWMSLSKLRKCKQVKWVSKTSERRYCYPTIEDAMRSFKRRKHMQQSKLNLQMEQVNKVVDNFDNFKSASIDELIQGVHLGHTETSIGYSWGL